ncbi:phosphoglycerate kinase [Candidatus Woesearchaeota archaeon]|nr:phosphoglycerate kinase [Candidatus Woesearchaeota archaeon]MBW3006483.1 phosphoglycerate kinase [Candidatus Woesearchaeota archaeon]
MKFNTLKNMDLEGKRVLVRVDFNVPLDKKGKILDDRRIKAVIPTIDYLLKKKALVILMSHLGRPKKVDDKLRMDVVAKRLGKLLKTNIIKLDDCIGASVEDQINEMQTGEVCLLENLRFYTEETKNNKFFAQSLAELADVYVNDAFATLHRKHASVYGIPYFLPSCAGLLVVKELKQLDKARKPRKPFFAIICGMKEDKLKAAEKMFTKASNLFIGGVLGNILLKARGHKIGKSKIEKLKLDKKFISSKKVITPEDVIVANKITAGAKTKTVTVDKIPANWYVVDIGPKTLKRIQEIVKNSRTVFWSGPPGMFEITKFSKGTRALAKLLSKADAVTIAGGGDTAEAIDKFKLARDFTHVSTGGGASVVYVEGEELAGIKALIESKKRFG